jgi:hypothetical protein
MIAVQEAKHLGDYRLWVRFNTGESGEVDLADVIERYPAATPLKEQSVFADFFLDEWPTIAWPCGFDVSPETLYELATGKAPPWLANLNAA